MRIIVASVVGACLWTGCGGSPTDPGDVPSGPATAAAASRDASPGVGASSPADPAALDVGIRRIKPAIPLPGMRSAAAPASAEPPSTVAAATDEVDASDGAGEEIPEEDLPREGDEIMVPPQMIGKLIPGLNLDAVGRTEPIGVKALLEARGISFTNYQQLVQLGVTNYQIIRAPAPAAAPGATEPK